MRGVHRARRALDEGQHLLQRRSRGLRSPPPRILRRMGSSARLLELPPSSRRLRASRTSRSRESPLDVAHRDVRRPRVLPEAVHRTDPRVIQLRRGLRLSPKAQPRIRRETHRPREQLQRDRSPELGVLGQVDRPLPAASELPQDPVVRDPRSSGSWTSPSSASDPQRQLQVGLPTRRSRIQGRRVVGSSIGSGHAQGHSTGRVPGSPSRAPSTRAAIHIAPSRRDPGGHGMFQKCIVDGFDDSGVACPDPWEP